MTYPKVTTTDQPPADGATPRATSVPSNPRFPEIEERVLRYWDADGTFIASVENRDAGTDGDNEFVFYDGPPFANGLPHYGHLLTGYVKDIVPRYQTMRGRRVERRFGWDTHGLPAELEAHAPARHLHPTKQDILVARHPRVQRRACRSVGAEATRGEWQDYVTRQARWVDFENDYKTLDLPATWSRVIWAFKEPVRQGPRVRGLPRPALLLARRDAAVQPRAAHGRRRLPGPPGPRGDRRAASWRPARRS